MFRLIVLLVAITCPTALPCALAAENTPTLAEVMADDATLHDITWADAQRGWAVGDRGVVLVTKDGGAHWRRVETPTDAPLYAISFIDAKRGWAVGGSTRPYTHTTSGVVLTTRDGGQTWESVMKSPLPLLSAVSFFDSKHGVAAGVGSDLYPSGLFETTDEGQSWRPLPGSRRQAWSAADLHRTSDGELIGGLVGTRGATATIVGREARDSTGVSDARGRHAIRMTNPSMGWLVGDGGLVRVTRDGGKTWTTPKANPDEQLADWFDWRGIEVLGPHVWIVGSPGSVVLQSHDGGGSWQIAETSCSTPLRSIRFVDERQGWAVGEFGVVLHTRDGGQTWRAQRGARRRAALAWIVGAPDDLPAELLAINAAGEGLRSVVASPLASERQLSSESQWRQLHEASLDCGANAIDADWRLTLESNDHGLSAETLQQLLNKRTDGQAMEWLAQRLARTLWTYRPSVVVLNEAAQGESSGLEKIFQVATNKALNLIETAPPEFTNLNSWRPERVVLVSPTDSRTNGGEKRVATGDFSSRLGATPAQWTRHARSLLATSHSVAPPLYRWRTLLGTPSPSSRHGNLTAGINLQRKGDARRPNFLPVHGRLEELKRLAQKQRNMERLMQHAQGDPSWAGQVMDLTGGLEASAGAGLLMQLAESYQETGRIDMAADTLYLLARRYPDSPSADAALLWLVKHYASGERAHVASRMAALRAQGQDTLSNVDSTATDFVKSLDSTPDVDLTSEERFQRASALCDYLKTARPALYANPSLRFTAAAAQRSRGFVKDSERTALLLSKQSISESWRRVAMAERWLNEPEGLPPEKPIVMCRYTPRRPKLDGLLDDVAWNQAELLELTSMGSDPEALVRFSCDEKFLYLAIEVLNGNSLPTTNASEERPRDATLSMQDRVRVKIDIDRDYETAYELTIDHRGWTHDALWGDRHWNPKWYVAAVAKENSEQSTWCAEAAIALDELVASDQLSRAAWAISVERLQPGERTAGWNGSSNHNDSADAFGLLLFE